MIILDTNVVSEIGKQVPAQKVLQWLYQWPGSDLYITAVTEAEIRFGISMVPAGKRRTSLQTFADRTIQHAFRGKNLPFDSEAAKQYAVIASRQRRAGMSVSVPEVQIAAIAAVRGFTVATRNTKHFLNTGITVVNPWIV